MNWIRINRNPSGGFTLVEMVMGMLIMSMVAMVCFGSYITLSKGFAFVASWSDVRTSLLRVLDTIAVDLRNATQVTISAPSSNRQTLTLTIPDHYGAYYASGQPFAQMISGTVDPSSYHVTGSISNLSVVYSWSPYGTTGQQLIRSGTYTAASGTATFTGTVATFDYSPSISYLVQSVGTTGLLTTATSGTAATLTNSLTPGICIQVSGSYDIFGTTHQTGTLQSIVNLRALNVYQ